jgi:hypothetical protein
MKVLVAVKRVVDYAGKCFYVVYTVFTIVFLLSMHVDDLGEVLPSLSFSILQTLP